jgi:hypothetical protein
MRTVGRAGIIVQLVVLPLGIAASQEESREKPSIAAMKVPDDSIVVDGILDERAWQQADSSTELIQCEPVFGVPSSEKTTIKIIYDTQNIYVGAVCYYHNINDVVARNLAHRNNDWDDQFYFVLDTFHDKTTGYYFGTNALGSKEEGFIDGPDRNNRDWDEVWQVKTRINSDNWSAEFQIPLRILRFADTDDQLWGFNVFRSLRKKNERAYFAPVPPQHSITNLALAGTITGIRGLGRKRNLQVKPFFLLGGTRVNTGTENANETEFGFDVKYVPLPNLAADFTYNTDFAQIESDDEQINLSRFSLFYPEKRDFFLEKAQLFEFGMAQKIQPFFSRRIGLSDGHPVPILAGGRLTAKFKGSNVGFLNVTTKNTPYQPLTNQTVLRFRQDVRGNSYFGFIFTNLEGEGSRQRSLGLDTELWPSEDMKLQIWYSSLDPPKIRTDQSAYHAGFNLNTDLHQFVLSHTTVGRKYDPAMGFVILKDLRDYSGLARKSFRFRDSWIRKINFEAIFDYMYTQEHKDFCRQNILQFSSEFESGDELQLQFNGTFEELQEEFAIYRAVNVPTGRYVYNTLSAQFQSNQRRDFSASVNCQVGSFYGGTQKGVSLLGSCAFSKHLSTSEGLEFNEVHLPSGSFTTTIVRMRWNLAFTSDLSLRTFFQYSSATRKVTSNVRLHYLFGNDSDFYVVLDNLSSVGGKRMIGEMNTVAVKLAYRFYI